MTPDRLDLDVSRQFSLLEEAWDNVTRHWHDDMARDFGTRHWAPLKQESWHYLEALRGLLETLTTAELSTAELAGE